MYLLYIKKIKISTYYNWYINLVFWNFENIQQIRKLFYKIVSLIVFFIQVEIYIIQT